MHVCLIYTWILKWFILCVGCTLLYLQFYILTVLHMLMYSVVLYWCVKFYAQTVVCWCVQFYDKTVVYWCILYSSFMLKLFVCWCILFYVKTELCMLTCPVLCSNLVFVGVSSFMLKQNFVFWCVQCYAKSVVYWCV